MQNHVSNKKIFFLLSAQISCYRLVLDTIILNKFWDAKSKITLQIFPKKKSGAKQIIIAENQYLKYIV